MKRFAAALFVGVVVAVLGVAIFKALDIGGLAWLALLVVAMFVASLVDREGFYGPRTPHTHA